MTDLHPQVIDRARLAMVAATSGDSEAALIAEFLASIAADAVRLREAAAHGDFAPASQSAHRIGGVCRTLGAARLADACDDVVLACAARSDHAVSCALLAFEEQHLQLQSKLSSETSPQERGGPPTDGPGR